MQEMPETQVWSLGWENPPPPTGVGKGNPLQYLEDFMDRGAWWATGHGVAESRTQLSTSLIVRCCPPTTYSTACFLSSRSPFSMSLQLYNSVFWCDFFPLRSARLNLSITCYTYYSGIFPMCSRVKSRCMVQVHLLEFTFSFHDTLFFLQLKLSLPVIWTSHIQWLTFTHWQIFSVYYMSSVGDTVMNTTEVVSALPSWTVHSISAWILGIWPL